MIDEGPTVRGDILQRQSSNHARDQAPMSRKRDRMERALAPALSRGEPDLLARRGPGQALLACPSFGERPSLSGSVDDCDRAAIVAEERMVEKCHGIAPRRDAGMANPAGCLVQDLPGRVFEPVAPSRRANNRETYAIRRPIGISDVFEQVARRAA